MKLNEFKKKVEELGRSFSETRSEKDYTELFNLLRPYYKSILRKYYIKNYIISDDIIADTFMILWNKIDTFDSKKPSFYNWLMTIMVNKALETKAKEHRYAYNYLDTEEYSTDYIEDSIDKMDMDKVKQFIIDTLEFFEHTDKELLIDKYINGYVNEELIEKYNIPNTTLKNRLFNGKLDILNYVHVYFDRDVFKNLRKSDHLIRTNINKKAFIFNKTKRVLTEEHKTKISKGIRKNNYKKYKQRKQLAEEQGIPVPKNILSEEHRKKISEAMTFNRYQKYLAKKQKLEENGLPVSEEILTIIKKAEIKLKINKS